MPVSGAQPAKVLDEISSVLSARSEPAKSAAAEMKLSRPPPEPCGVVVDGDAGRCRLEAGGPGLLGRAAATRRRCR